MTFGERLSLTMKSRKIYGSELARMIGYNESTIYKWRHDESAPNLNALVSLCKALKCSADWLVFGKR